MSGLQFDNETCECSSPCARERGEPYGGRCRRKPVGAIVVRLTPEEAQAMLDHHDQEGLSLVGDQWRHVDTAKAKIAAAKAESE